ncbi:putative eka-like protein [Erysiphe necator]|uniref:Putative eka-like protein n=1 Tax=Uncinula necator TaxID=52586 RepID=A0A0B1PF90_UNCNE|nr:putative eka-like protein [Erysiphe necator]
MGTDSNRKALDESQNLPKTAQMEKNTWATVARAGFALSPCSAEAREQILKAENSLFLSGAKLETATNWVSERVPTVPAFVKMEQGVVEVSKDMLSDKIERVSSMRPAHLKLYGRNNLKVPHRTWLAYFPKAPRRGFRVFDESRMVRPYKKHQPIEFCKRCNGHRPSKNCSRAPSCANFRSTNHTADNCMATTKCRNCGGPHRADSRRCLACPMRSSAPTKEQLKTYRQMREREYNAVQRARVAEEKAVSIDKTEIDLTSSQASKKNMILDNSQAIPVEDTTVVSERTKKYLSFDLRLSFDGQRIWPRAATYIRKLEKNRTG